MSVPSLAGQRRDSVRFAAKVQLGKLDLQFAIIQNLGHQNIPDRDINAGHGKNSS
jgi:hypothetical protein